MGALSETWVDFLDKFNSSEVGSYKTKSCVTFL